MAGHTNMASGCKVWMGGLDPTANKGDIEAYFGTSRPIKNIWVAQKPPGFAFIEFLNPEDAAAAVADAMASKKMIHDRSVRVEVSTTTHRPGDPRPPRKDFYNGGYRGGVWNGPGGGRGNGGGGGYPRDGYGGGRDDGYRRRSRSRSRERQRDRSRDRDYRRRSRSRSRERSSTRRHSRERSRDRSPRRRDSRSPPRRRDSSRDRRRDSRSPPRRRDGSRDRRRDSRDRSPRRDRSPKRDGTEVPAAAPAAAASSNSPRAD